MAKSAFGISESSQQASMAGASSDLLKFDPPGSFGIQGGVACRRPTNKVNRIDEEIGESPKVDGWPPSR
jgi:hypothetical protein